MILILLLVAGAGLVIGIFAIDISPSCIAKDGVITVLDTWEAEFKKVGIAYADDDKSKGECKNARKRAYELVSELYVADKSTLTVRFDGGEKRTTQDDIVSYLIGKCIDDEDVKEKNKLYVEGDGGAALVEVVKARFTNMTYITGDKNSAFCYAPVAMGFLEITPNTKGAIKTTIPTTLSYVSGEDGEIRIATQLTSLPLEILAQYAELQKILTGLMTPTPVSP